MSQKLPYILLVTIGLLFILIPVFHASAQEDLLSVVQDYQRLHNQEEVELVMELFTEDAVFEVAGLGVFADDALRQIHEYDAGINGRLAFINCEVDAGTARCQTVEFNDWIEAAGLQPIFYPSSIFTIHNGKINRIVATMSPESAQAMGETLAVFVPWLMENRPEESAPLFSPDGAFIYSERNGELVVQLLREWRSEGTS